MERELGEGADGLPEWAKKMYEDYGSPNLIELKDRFHGPLIERKSGIRRDDIIEILLDSRLLPEDRNPVVRGMLIGFTRNSVEILDEFGDFRAITRDVIIEVRLITHLRHPYIEDKELLKFEKEDMRRRSEMHEKAEKNDDGYESNLWG